MHSLYLLMRSSACKKPSRSKRIGVLFITARNILNHRRGHGRSRRPPPAHSSRLRGGQQPQWWWPWWLVKPPQEQLLVRRHPLLFVHGVQDISEELGAVVLSAALELRLQGIPLELGNNFYVYVHLSLTKEYFTDT